MTGWPWDELGIDQTRDTKAIRSAYSAKLKELDLDTQIDEYSSLRQARSYALQLAQMPEEEEDYGLGDPTQDWDEGEGGVPLHYETDTSAQQPVHGSDQGLADSEPASAPDPDGELASQKFNAISQIVLPDGEQSDDAFTYEENEEAGELLREMLEVASNATLDLYQGLDFHLSELLAMGWPRSAPLVEASNAQFNWFAEIGQITERPALVFLNARLAGMRFQEEVETPGHRYHKAWNDLASGGPPVWLKRNWLSRNTVLELLGIIRNQYPELESLLDPMRIQDWENATMSVFARAIQIVAALWFLGSALRFCAGDQPQSADVIISQDGQAVEAVYAEVVVDILGDEWSGERLEQTSPLLARYFRRAAEQYRGSDGKPSVVTASVEARHDARFVLVDKRDTLGFDDQVRAYQLYLNWLTMAREQGPAKCLAMLNGADFIPDRTQGANAEANYDEEKDLLNILLEKGDPLASNEPSETRTASIPGWVIGEIMTKTRLSQEQVSEGLSRSDSKQRCDVMIALMEVVARAPSKVPSEVLTVP